MQNKLTILFVLSILLFLVLGCGVAKEISKAIDKNGKPKIVKSKQNKVQLKIPSSWSTSPDLHEEATLAVSRTQRELYTVVIPDSKEDFDESADLEFFTNVVRTNTEDTIQNSTYTAVTALKINGYDAKRFEVAGTVNKVKINYIFTIVDTPDYFYQIAAWTLKSKFEENKPVLLDVIDSFKLVGNGSGFSSSPPSPPKPPQVAE